MHVMHMPETCCFCTSWQHVTTRWAHWVLAFYLAGGNHAALLHVDRDPGAALVAERAMPGHGGVLILFPRSLITIFYWFFISIGNMRSRALVHPGVFLPGCVRQFCRAGWCGHMAHIGGTIFGSMICWDWYHHLLPRSVGCLGTHSAWNKRRQYGSVSRDTTRRLQRGHEADTQRRKSMPSGSRYAGKLMRDE